MHYIYIHHLTSTLKAKYVYTAICAGLYISSIMITIKRYFPYNIHIFFHCRNRTSAEKKYFPSHRIGENIVITVLDNFNVC